MPRSSISGGASMSGPTYEPQVTPWDREDEDVSVLGSNRSRDRYSGNEFSRQDSYSENRNHRRDRADADVYNRRDLTPTYGDNNERGDRRYDEERRQDYAQFDPARPWVGYGDRLRDEQRERDVRYSQNRDYDWDYDYRSRDPNESGIRGPRQGRR